MSDEKKNPDKRGIFLTSNSHISLQIIKSERLKDKYTIHYAILSDSPISISFKNPITNSFSCFSDRHISDSEDSDSNLNPTKRQKRQEERELMKFWSTECGLLPEILTRIPKSEHSRQLQHSQLVETCHLGKSYLSSIRSDNDRLNWENESKDKEINRLNAKILELEMKNDIMERQLRKARSEASSPNERPVTSPEEQQQSRKCNNNLNKNIIAAPNVSPNDSIFGRMANESIQAEDFGIIGVKRRPPPLMGLKVSPPSQRRHSPNKPTTPTFQLSGRGHFNFSSRGGRGGFHNRAIRGGQHKSRYDDAVASHRWQQQTFTFGQNSPRKTTTTVTASTAAATAAMVTTTPGPGPSAKKSPPKKSPPKEDQLPKPVRTRLGAKKVNEQRPAQEEAKKEDSESDDEILRCHPSREDEMFMECRLASYEDMF